jgi:hypothetical protein
MRRDELAVMISQLQAPRPFLKGVVVFAWLVGDFDDPR